jgi:hypothetical protein
MTDEVIRQLPREEVDEELEEEWIRATDEPEVRNVGASKSAEYGWQVSIWAAEFVREDPLEAVPGVTNVWEEDREVWHVDGSPSGADLTRAAAEVMDDLADDIRTHLS